MIAFADTNIPFLHEALSGKVDLRVVQKSEINHDNLIKHSVEALFIRSTIKVYRELLEGTKVRFIATATSGIDHLDTNYLNKSSIAYFSAPGSNANSVAEYVIFAILKWHLLTNLDLKEKRIGIIGFGNIGKLVAKYCNNFGIEIFVNDPPLVKENFQFPEYVKIVTLDEIFENCHIITNHVPLTFEGEFPTNYLISADLLNKIEEDSLFIHTSRGSIVEEAALRNLMSEKKMHLAIDVWENEPNFDSFLARNAILATPHLAGYSYDGKLKGTQMVLKHFEDFFGIEADYSRIDQEMSMYNKSNLNFASPLEIFKILRSRRAFETDVHNFLEFVDLNDEEKEKAFFETRNNYPKRRESLK
jgi:erythronate-4-phosphate dehydrogenase